MSQDLHGEDEILGKAYDARLMRRILRYLQPYWKLLAVALAFLIFIRQPSCSAPISLKSPSTAISRPGDIGGLDSMVLIYLGTVIAGFIFLFIQTYTTEYAGQRAMHDLRMQIFTHLQRQDMDYFRSQSGRTSDDPHGK